MKNCGPVILHNWFGQLGKDLFCETDSVVLFSFLVSFLALLYQTPYANRKESVMMQEMFGGREI